MANVVNKVFHSPFLRKALFHGRFLLAAGLLALVAAFMHAEWLPIAFAISLVGELIQGWCFGSLVKNEQVTSRGPYALCRNPMYLGRLLTFLGFVLLLDNLWIAGAYVVLYVLYMTNRVEREERRLRGWLGEPYERYCSEVNRFFPSPVRLFRSEVRFFSWGTFTYNNGHWNLLSTLAAYAVLFAIAYALR